MKIANAMVSLVASSKLKCLEKDPTPKRHYLPSRNSFNDITLSSLVRASSLVPAISIKRQSKKKAAILRLQLFSYPTNLFKRFYIMSLALHYNFCVAICRNRCSFITCKFLHIAFYRRSVAIFLSCSAIRTEILFN